MIDAARSRILEICGAPNEAAARVLFEILAEEDEHSNIKEIDGNLYWTLVGEYYADETTGDNVKDTVVITKKRKVFPVRAYSNPSVPTRDNKKMNADSMSPDADFLTNFCSPATYRVNNVNDLPTVPKIFHDTTD